jgi:protein tyrosine/serine phosphatase
MMKKWLVLGVVLATIPGCGRPDMVAPSANSAPSGISAMSMSQLAAQDDENLPAASNEDLGHFFQVDEHLYRGQQPTDHGFELLKAKGVKTVVNLREKSAQIAHEKEVVEKLGMKYVSIPINCLKPVSQAPVQAWVKVFSDPANGPIFVHCQHGRDRTGAFVGVYRIQHDGWKFKQTYAEMKEKGYRTFWLNLTYATWKFCKTHDQSTPAPAELVNAGLAF